ncbi:YadA-like family protein [Gallibacterium anatis]|uniref:YadA-like family protein n=1 Tax=Gallibacterium anatis TaxID=750 RepID=A0AAX3XG13_9PAST|nr:YadA-like family protein [Gallibacterium anatis]MDK9430313.1 YadA-like family protein [Gallibacterium anatis]WIM79872.1 YadA-like family protein [Gallibacterium anatis]
MKTNILFTLSTLAIAVNAVAAAGDPVKQGTSNNNGGLAVGESATANFSVAMGQGAKASANYANAIGGGSQALKQGAIAVGQAAVAKEDYTIAVGYGAQANESHAMGFGFGARANAKNSIAFGGTNDVANTASFNNRKITNVFNGNIAQNSKEVVNGGQLYTVQEDLKKKVDSGTVEGAGSLAVGKIAEAKGYIATAVGYAHALDTYTVAMGVNAYAYNANGIAIGTLAKAGATNEDYANADIFDRIDPETGKPLYNVSPGGDPRTIRSGAIAIGNGAEAVGYRNTVIGEAAKAGIIIDRDAYNHPNKFGLGAVGATAIGAAAIAGGSQATVVGNGAVAEGKLSVGMGTRSYTTGKADTAVGTYSVVTEDSAVALGAYARADHKNSVALGNSSITEDVKATASTTINGKEYTFAGGDQSQVVGTVSIGGKGVVGYTDTTDKGHWNDPAHYTNGNGRTDMGNAIYRTITNVAAGRINADSTDAINGSQLYAVMGATEENRKLIENNAINLAQTDHRINRRIDSVEEESRAGDAMNRKLIENNTIKLAQTDHRINRRIDSVEEESRAGDAMNAALAALKPLQYDPNEKFQVMAGTGRFKDKQGFALGVAHHINENLLLNAGAAYSGSKYKTWNAGITYRFGSSNQKAPVIKVSNDEQRIRSLEQENMMLKQRLAAIEAKLSKLK